MRAVLIAVLVVLACTLSVSASSADWSAPEALWSSDLSASELEARHSEFLMATDGSSSSSSTGPNLAASSTAFNFVPIPLVPPPEPIAVLLNIDTSACTENSTDPTCFFTPAGAAKLEAAVTASFGFPDTFNFPGEQFIATFASVAASSSTGPTGRRLLQAGGTAATFDFIGSPKDGGIHARKIYAAFSESLACTNAACQDNLQKKYDLPSSPAAASVFTVAAASVVAGSLKVDEAAVKAGSDDALGVDANERNVNTVGGPRNTNIGYYVLGAVLLAFIVAALVYFIVHKKPVQAVVKEEPLRRDEVVAAPVVAAPVAYNSGVVVAEEQPLAAGQQQMDYRSVFALKHNVLDKSAEQKAAEEDEHNHNDVHFILHQ